MPVNESTFMFYLMGRCHSKVIYQKLMFFLNIGNDYTLKNCSQKFKKNYFQFCIDYESNKH